MQKSAFALGMFQNGGERVLGLVVDGKAFSLAAVGDVADLARLKGMTLDQVLQDWERNFAILTKAAESVRGGGGASDLDMSKACPPVERPSKILCAAANYKAHVEEMRKSNYAGKYDAQKDFMGEKSRARPYLFLKAPSSLCGANDDIHIPADQKTDWEVELVLVIGKRCRNVKAEDAPHVVAGYMVGNDISCRTLLWREDRQTVRSDWLGSKCHDTFGPIGPLFVPREFVSDPGNLRIQLKLNGVVKQNGNTGEMIFSPDEQIEYVSAMMTLLPGDLIFTGTPSGVGQGSGEFLKDGDLLECEIEGLGAQRNRIVQIGARS